MNIVVVVNSVWIIPANSKVFTKQLVNAVNLTYKKQFPLYQKVLQLLYVTNLSGLEMKSTSLDNLSFYRDQFTLLETFKSTLLTSQQKVWQQMMSSI